MQYATVEPDYIQVILEQTSDAIFIKDLEGRYALVNRACAQILGREPRDIIGRTDLELLDAPVADRLMADDRLVLQTGQSHDFEAKLGAANGYRIMHSTKCALRDSSGAVTALFCVSRDVTDLREREGQTLELYREQAARLEAESLMKRAALLAEVTSVLASSLDVQTTLTNFVRIIASRLADWCAVVMQDDVDVIRCMACAHVESKREPPLEKLINELMSAIDSRHPVSDAIREGRTTLISAVSNGGEHTGFLEKLGAGSLIVIPLRVKAALAGAVVLASREELRHGPGDFALAEALVTRASLAIENASLYEEAQKAIRARDEFLSIASHELRTPLTPLKVQAQLLKRLMERDLLATMPREELLMILATADREINRLSKLITNLLSVSRIAEGSGQLEREPVEIGRLLKDLVERLHDEIRASGSPVEVDTDLRDPVAHWDALRIEQVVANLLTNAVKYGCGRPISIRASDSADTIRIEVEDRGMGISKNEQARIFERFERADAARRFAGMGLGLYIARQIVHAHAGTIDVRSELGAGSTFIVELPR